MLSHEQRDAGDHPDEQRGGKPCQYVRSRRTGSNATAAALGLIRLGLLWFSTLGIGLWLRGPTRSDDLD